MDLYLTPYLNASRTAHAMRFALKQEKFEVALMRTEGSKYKPEKGHKVLNWGSVTNQVKDFEKNHLIWNPPSVVEFLNNRAGLYKFLKDNNVPIPLFAETKRDYREVFNGGCVFVTRSRKKGNEGKDISFDPVPVPEDFRSNPNTFLVEYIPKSFEFRVSLKRINKGSSIFLIESKLPLEKDIEEHNVDISMLDWRVRSRRNGFAYVKATPEEVPEIVRNVSRNAFEALMTEFKEKLPFCSFEVIYSGKKDEAYVIDASVNPVLEDKKSIEYYAKVLKDLA